MIKRARELPFIKNRIKAIFKTKQKPKNKQETTKMFTKTFLTACAVAATSTLAIELRTTLQQKGTKVKAPETQNAATETKYTNVDDPTEKNWLYLSTDEYQAHTAAEKLDMLWGLMVPNGVEDGPQDIQFVEFPELLEDTAGSSFNNESDELPKAKDTKSNHS